MLPPSPLTPDAEPALRTRPTWWRTLGAAAVLPPVGFLLTWGPAEVVQAVWPRPLGLPSVGILPLLGPGWPTLILMVTVAFGLAPGTLIGLIDRHRPYLAAAIAPAGFGLYVAAAYGIVGAMGRMPYFSWLVLLPTVVGPLATWLSAAAAIALVRAVRRS